MSGASVIRPRVCVCVRACVHDASEVSRRAIAGSQTVARKAPKRVRARKRSKERDKATGVFSLLDDVQSSSCHRCCCSSLHLALSLSGRNGAKSALLELSRALGVVLVSPSPPYRVYVCADALVVAFVYFRTLFIRACVRASLLFANLFFLEKVFFFFSLFCCVVCL